MEDVGTVNIMIVLSKISSVPLQIATSITNVTFIGMYVNMNKTICIYYLVRLTLYAANSLRDYFSL